MKMTILILSLLTACASKVPEKKVTSVSPTDTHPELIKVAEFHGAQVTGVTVSRDGRMFASFPRWREKVPYSVVEILKDGSVKPYPNADWNKWKGKPKKNTFTCVQSVVANLGSLFVLDPSSPRMAGVVGKPTLYEFDLLTNTLKRSWTFDPKVAPKKSYLNDFRVDNDNQKVYITDSGLGGIVVLDLIDGTSRRVLDRHPSTKAENVTLLMNGKVFTLKGAAPRIHADGIAISPLTNKLYYHALTAYHLYAIPVSELSDKEVAPEKVAESVQDLGVTPAPDGMIFDHQGNLYMGDLERNAIAYRTPLGDLRILVQDERISWPDTFAIDPDNNLVFTDSRINHAPAGVPVGNLTFSIYKVKLPVTID